MRRLFLLQLAGNALLLWLAYEWLGVDESSGLKLLWSALDALLILALACWLHGATMVYGSETGAPINAAFRKSLENLGVLLLLAIVALTVYALVGKSAAASDQLAFHMASWMTLNFRKPVKPATIRAIFQTGFWIVRWVLLPVLLLPLASGFAVHGWRGWRAAAVQRSRRYWMAVPVLALVGIRLPLLIMEWGPVGGFGLQLVSFAVRAVVAYLLFVGAILLLARLRPSPDYAFAPKP